ncbi:DNA primase [Enterococcus faecalis]|uniref:DNA primase family protein n=1 Tax=Enterococcus faecalis TaxID=1351 RepID=UPI0003A5E458|nr:DNA primase family protein [Enterococcus faecalis]NSQ42108.1 DNA primase [Enterococcus faecalis]NSQ53166.1 DNA primase [Enterococcus faecalis]NSR34740.1 DNA primase [Enterococcus faecalis]NSS31722.1 DNA primase [Enterococcus faecalis]NST05580.1 DNA primase [Enterococcus faecalis]
MSIYVSKGFSKKMKMVEGISPFQYLVEYVPEKVTLGEQATKESIEPIKRKASYFLAGELIGKRSNDNLLRKELIAIDYDELEDRDFENFIKKIAEALKGISYILYPTIKNNVSDFGLRYRLVIDTDRSYTKEENDCLWQNTVNKIGMKADLASKTYSQVAGLPILNEFSSETLIVRQQANPLKVDEYLSVSEEQQTYKEEKIVRKELTKEVAIKMVEAYVENVGEKLLDRAYYLNPYMNIKYAFETGEIDFDTVQESLTLLALGNSDWATHNIEHFKRDTSPVKNGTPFVDFFGWAYNDPYEEFEGIVLEETQVLYSGNELKFALAERRKKELKKLKRSWEKSGGRGKPPTSLSTLQCGRILQEYIEFCLFDMEENTRLAMYQPKEGIYTQNETQIKRVIGWLEPKHNARAVNDVIFHIWKEAKIKPKTVSRYLIPVKNGVFNLKTKQLESFSPNYVFTSKIATSYAENPSLPKFNDWDVESWLNEIACGDAQITTLLWQVISDAINGNYSRKKSIWLMGDGSNGKGTYQQLLYNLIGPQNIATLKINQFSERFKLALLVEKVAVIGDDVGAGIYIDDSSEFNSVVTNETILIEVKNRMPYSARMYVTVIQSTNEMPKIRNKSNGTYRRLLIVPFNASFEGTKDDWRIKEEYINRKEVLEYVLHKAVNMDFERFIVPDVSKKLLEEYKQENDPLVDFKETVFKPLGINKIPFYMVYSQYKEFCNENNFKPLSKIKFSKQFTYLLGKNWANKNAKYSMNEIEKIKALGDFFNYEEPPEKGAAYKSLVRNDLKLIS